MHYLSILTSLILFSHQIPTAIDGNASFYSYYSGKKYDFQVTESDLRRAPPWHEHEDNPPLPPRKAVTVASTYLGQLLPDAESWSVEKVSLQRAGGKSDINWVYVIEFTGPLASGSSQLGGMVHTFTIVVLMNGVAVEPKISSGE
jgi:hypothetical protein